MYVFVGLQSFLYQITAASRTPEYEATAAMSLFSLSLFSTTEFVEPSPVPPPSSPEKISGYATGVGRA